MKIGKLHKWIAQGETVFACKWCKRRLRVDAWSHVLWPAKCRIVATVYPDELRFLTPERLDFLGDYVRVDV